jgi:integrase
MRKGEILNLRWIQIRNGFVSLEKTMTKNRRVIPVNEELAAILKEIRKEEGLTSEYVLTYARRAIDRVDRAFRTAPSTKVIPLVTY